MEFMVKVCTRDLCLVAFAEFRVRQIDFFGTVDFTFTFPGYGQTRRFECARILKLEEGMDKKIAGLLGAVAGLATAGAAQAAIEPAPNASQALHASSYADLLTPVSNAVEALKADNAAREQNIKLAQAYYGYSYPSPPPAYGYYPYYHHHHHHNQYGHYRRDHHHHHNGAYIGIPGVGGVVVNGR